MMELTDIEHVLSTLTGKITLLENKVQVLEKDNAFLRFRNHQLEMENSHLRERLSKYESPKKDSHNSSIPPIQPQLTQHRIVGKHCTCGCLAKGQAPSHVKGFVSYGSNSFKKPSTNEKRKNGI